MSANRLLDDALAAHAAGLVVMPVNAGGAYDKRPHLVLMETGHRAPSRKSPGRWAPSWRPLMVEPPSEDMVVAWFRHPAGKGLAFVTGQRSGRVVIDLDGASGDELRQRWGVRPHVRTGSGGWHVHVAAPPWRVPTLNSKSMTALGAAFPGLDSRADGGYAILPPTVSRAGPYTWRRPLADLEGTDFLPVPAQVLLGLLSPPVPPSAPPPAARPDPPRALAGAGGSPPPTTTQDAVDEALRLVNALYGRDNAGFWLARVLRDRGQGREEVKALAFHTLVPGHNIKGEVEPYTREQWEASVDSAFTRAAQVKARKPGPVATPDRLVRVWPYLDEEERRQALRCVAASWTAQGEAARVEAFFLALAVPWEVIAAELRVLRQQRARGVLLPGLTALATRYLPGWERRAAG
ncbi:bifunctional DNA primase/polymerase [Deinococcus sp. DB0503]|uniref:bifunctional DNA primase/polymerase n=1 Tax=Deinococcus sp. DB0503 TaxID=2479203 RepID=UPI0018DF53D0|nr:bifunctional DNA primase/polymerase [Deinococcus sp. DB0503]MBI0446913.1 hypothetical protein [Deinococcus sp. DB0503]